MSFEKKPPETSLDLITTSHKLLSLPLLSKRKDVRVRWTPLMPSRSAIATGWGLKRSGLWAKEMKESFGCRAYLLEDGFLRSANRKDPALSIVIDDLGIYYDAANPSRLEEMIGRDLTSINAGRARDLRKRWVSGSVSKYNSSREYEDDLPSEYVLVIDQVARDESVSGGGSGSETFVKMLQAALDENPGAVVLVKTHPDKASRAAVGYYSKASEDIDQRIKVIDDACHPVRLIQSAKTVYVATSQVGFEALMHGMPVRCFGMPFYAGWGLTRDELPAPERRKPVQIENLIHAALVDYPIYGDPATGREMAPEEAINWMASVRRAISATPAELYAVGFSQWKRPILRRMCPGSDITFCSARKVPDEAHVALWGPGRPAGLPGSAVIYRIEDGFLRSAGLGVDLAQPYSWIIDRTGIHFDPSRPSDLENILQSVQIDQHMIDRARALRRRIVSAGLSKYNESAKVVWRPSSSPGQGVIFVPGQVEGDASIAAGSPHIKTNADLLRAAREIDPAAWIVYKPHPDVQSGIRPEDTSPDVIKEMADEVIKDVPLSAIFPHIDAVHVMTSFVGFEALMRNISVYCWGVPFYAGWGVTNDMQPISYRSGNRSLDEIVAAALIIYPVYSDPASGAIITPEQTTLKLMDDRVGHRKWTAVRIVRRTIAGIERKRGHLFRWLQRRILSRRQSRGKHRS